MKTMKMFVTALVCFASVACVKENMDPQVSAPQENVAFTGVRSDYGGTKTKTVLTEDYKVLWDADDAIAVWDGTEIYRIENGKGRIPSETLRNAGWNVGYKYSVTTKVNSASTGFKYSFYQDEANHIKDNHTQGTADAEGGLVSGFKDISEGYELASGEGMWYLMNSNFNLNFIADCQARQFRAWLDDDQKIPVGTFVDNRDFAVAKTQDLSQPVVFKNAVALLEFVVPAQMDGKISKITVVPNASGEYLAGDLLIDYSGDAPVTSLWALSDEHNKLESGKSKYTTLKLVPASGSAFTAGKYYAVACPGTLSKGLTVTATLTSGLTLTRSSEKKCTFNESNVYGMGEINAADYSTDGPGLVATACETSSSTVAFSWSYGGTAAVDVAHGYSISLYKDSECKELVVSHNISAGNACWESRVPKFCFAGLEQNTAYYLKVVDADYGWESNVASAKTTTFDIVEVSTAQAAVNDVILAEDFSEMIGGGEAAVLAAGACSNVDDKLDPFAVMSGELPGAVFKKKGDEYNYKTYLANIKDTRLTDWGYYTTSGSVIYIHPGHVKIGTGSNITYLVTPALSSIPEGKSAELDVKITCAKLISTDFSAMIAVESGTLDENKKFSTLTNANITEFTVTNSGSWAEYTVTVKNVKKGNRLVIGAHKDVATGSSRGVMYISDVTVRMKQISDIQ